MHKKRGEKGEQGGEKAKINDRLGRKKGGGAARLREER